VSQSTSCTLTPSAKAQHNPFLLASRSNHSFSGELAKRPSSRPCDRRELVRERCRRDYKAAANKDEKAFYLLYLDGVREGIIELNVALEEKRQQPLFCLPDKLALTVGQAEDIVMRQAEKITDPDQLPIGLLLAQGLQNKFPCDEKH